MSEKENTRTSITSNTPLHLQFLGKLVSDGRHSFFKTADDTVVS